MCTKTKLLQLESRLPRMVAQCQSLTAVERRTAHQQDVHCLQSFFWSCQVRLCFPTLDQHQCSRVGCTTEKNIWETYLHQSSVWSEAFLLDCCKSTLHIYIISYHHFSQSLTIMYHYPTKFPPNMSFLTKSKSKQPNFEHRPLTRSHMFLHCC